MLSAKEVIVIHDLVIAEGGGLTGNHGIDAIEGALSRVMNHMAYAQMDDVFDVAAMLAVSIARGHIFNDGNKRTALMSAITYLDREGFKLRTSMQLEEVMVDVAQGALDEKALSEIFFALYSSDT